MKFAFQLSISSSAQRLSPATFGAWYVQALHERVSGRFAPRPWNGLPSGVRMRLPWILSPREAPLSLVPPDPPLVPAEPPDPETAPDPAAAAEPPDPALASLVPPLPAVAPLPALPLAVPPDPEP